MIDVRRARHMTKMAMFEENEAGDYKSITRYDRKSYVSLWTFIYAVLSLVISLVYIFTAFYIILVLNPEGVRTGFWILFGVVSVAGMVCHVFFYVKHARRKAEKRYDESRAQNDYIEEQYKILDEMYEERS